MRMIDSHVHLSQNHPGKLFALTEKYGYEKIGVMAVPCYYSPLNTLECMLMKRANPEKVFLFGGMTYLPTLEPTAKSHEKQLELMMDAGCDGWKLLESKPSVYRELQLPLDGEVFSRAFAMAEQNRIPIKWHAGDPAPFWDAEKAPDFAVQNGWLCIGEGFPSLQQIYDQVENVMARHPKLSVAMAHLYFISDDRPHGERLLEQYENFLMDITPGCEMYVAFRSDIEGWAAFFRRWQDKIEFGTDTTDASTDPSIDAKLQMILGTLRESPANSGFGLEPEILEKILAKNFERRTGPSPRPFSESGLNAYAEWLLPQLPKALQTQAERLLSNA